MTSETLAVARDDGPGQSGRTRRHAAIGLLVGCVLLGSVLARVDLARLGRELRSISPSWIVLAVGVAMVAAALRAWRWGIIIGNYKLANFPMLFSSMMIGYAANNILPARMGEIARVWVLDRKIGVGMSRGLATVILERLIDSAALLGLLGLCWFIVPLPVVMRGSGLVGALALLTGLVAVVALARKGHSVLTPVSRALHRRSTRMGGRFDAVAARFLSGLGVLTDGPQLARLLGLTLAIWAAESLCVLLIMSALGLSPPWIAALFVLALLSLSFLIPASPGAIGVYEFLVVAALAPFALEPTRAMSVALVLHAFSFANSTSIGLICLVFEDLTFRDLAARPDSSKPRSVS